MLNILDLYEMKTLLKAFTLINNSELLNNSLTVKCTLLDYGKHRNLEMLCSIEMQEFCKLNPCSI